MTPSGDQKYVRIPKDHYDELRTRERPRWYRRHMVSLILSGIFSVVVAVAGVVLDQRTGRRMEAMDKRIHSVQDQVGGITGQLKLVGDRIQSMGDRIQSMDTRLIEVQVKVGTIEGRLGERLGSAEKPADTPVPTGDSPHAVEVPGLNRTDPTRRGTHRRVGRSSDTSHREELVH